MEKLATRKAGKDLVITPELARAVCEASQEVRRQVGVMIDRSGAVQFVLVGTSSEVVIPELSRFRQLPGKLRGLRLVHTHLAGEDLTDDDMTDLALLRLDSITALHFNQQGIPTRMQTAHLLPQNPDNKLYDFLPDTDIHHQKAEYDWFIETLEAEINEKAVSQHNVKQEAAAILVGMFADKIEAREHMDELKELSRSAHITVLDTFTQVKSNLHPKYVVGPGKLKEIVIKALQKGADMIVVDNTLTPAQAKALSTFTELKVIDRTQLILDIFARRATSNEGKIRVELAQLQYILPRLSSRDDSLSRLTGGIGGRGPGETKLEIDRRRVHDRIAFLAGKLKTIERNREVQRAKRQKNELPLVSIIGYTNAGKSTLLNNLTNADVFADNLMFATLDTSSKRIRFPRERDVIITDTVGFIRDLPVNLAGAFKATLEELGEADLLLHVVDISSPHFAKHIHSVHRILEELGFSEKNQLLVFNKSDLLDQETRLEMEDHFPHAIFISALKRESFRQLLEQIEFILFQEGHEPHFDILEHFGRSTDADPES